MKTNYQTMDAAATGLAVPGAVSVAMAELAEDMREGLLALAVGAGAACHAGVDGGQR